MATILAYTSPALGHMLPISALLSELSRRGHAIHLRTLSVGVEIGQRLGFTTDAIDQQIEGLEHDDWKATNPRAALQRAFAVFGRRAPHEVTDLAGAIARVDPDALLIDVMCWGGLSAAEAGGIPWASFSPFTPLLRADGMPPYGPGLRPSPNLFGRVRDAVVGTLVGGTLKGGLPPINKIREELHLRRVGSMDEFWRRAALMLLARANPLASTNAAYRHAV